MVQLRIGVGSAVYLLYYRRMTRPLRLEAEVTVCHLLGRGNERKA